MSIVSRVILVMCVFALVGPPVGGAVAWLMMGARSLRSPLPFVTGAYGEGTALAIGTGIVCCAVALLLRKTGWLVPIGTTLVVNAITIAVGMAIEPPRGDLLASVARVAAVFVPASIIAAIVCWTISRGVLKPGA